MPVRPFRNHSQPVSGGRGTSGLRPLATNRQAPHYYHLLERFEAGLELTGTEVKSIREGKANLKDGFAMIDKGEVWLVACHISPYSAGGGLNHEPLRRRRLLLHKQEIHKLAGRTRERGLTLIPLALYLKNNRIKCELALAKGKKVHDRREALRRKTSEREAEQAVREHRRRHES